MIIRYTIKTHINNRNEGLNPLIQEMGCSKSAFYDLLSKKNRMFKRNFTSKSAFSVMCNHPSRHMSMKKEWFYNLISEVSGKTSEEIKQLINS